MNIKKGYWLGKGDLEIKLIDTPGLGDPELPMDELCENIDNELDGQNIDIVLCVIKSDEYRFDIKQMMTIEFIGEFVNDLKKENIILVLTHCDQAVPE